MNGFDPAKYGEEIAKLIPEEKPNSLGPGTPNSSMKPVLNAVSVDQLFKHTSMKDRDMAKACLSGLWLYYDFLDESHSISQSIHTPTGSFWHGIMHRREPDYGNSGYWFRKVGSHPVFDPLCAEASKIAQSMGTTSASEFLAGQSAWNPFQFIQLCEQSYQTGAQDEHLCEAVQLKEWQILFDYCYTHAV